MPRLLALSLLLASCAAATGNTPTVLVKECGSEQSVSAPIPADAATFGIAASATACGPHLVPAPGAPATACDGLHVEPEATTESCVQLSPIRFDGKGNVSAYCRTTDGVGDNLFAIWRPADVANKEVDPNGCIVAAGSIIFRFE